MTRCSPIYNCRHQYEFVYSETNFRRRGIHGEYLSNSAAGSRPHTSPRGFRVLNYRQQANLTHFEGLM